VTYRSASASASVRFRIDAQDVAEPLTLPARGDWGTETLAQSVPLRAGVQSVRLIAERATPDFELRSLGLEPE
jgi:hypothetical protein